MSTIQFLLALVMSQQAISEPQPVDSQVETSQAESPGQVATADSEDAAEEGQRMICRRESIAGSRLRTRETCKTADGWKEHKEQTRRSFDQATKRHAATPM